jgi:hypothetical protein
VGNVRGDDWGAFSRLNAAPSAGQFRPDGFPVTKGNAVPPRLTFGDAQVFLRPVDNTGMDTSAIAALATEMATQRTMQAAQIAVLKKAMDLQGAGAMQLIQSLPAPVSNPAHLGNSVDVFV